MQAENLVKKIIIKRVCVNCGRIELRCKCSSSVIQDVEAVYYHPAPIELQPEELKQKNAEEEAARLKIIADKFAAKEENKKQREETMRIMNLDDDELAEEKEEQSEEKKALEKSIIERAADFVNKVEQKKSELAGSGKDPKVARLELKEFKRNLKAQNNLEIEEYDVLDTPMKDPATGEFYDASKKDDADLDASGGEDKDASEDADDKARDGLDELKKFFEKDEDAAESSKDDEVEASKSDDAASGDDDKDKAPEKKKRGRPAKNKDK